MFFRNAATFYQTARHVSASLPGVIMRRYILIKTERQRPAAVDSNNFCYFRQYKLHVLVVLTILGHFKYITVKHKVKCTHIYTKARASTHTRARAHA